MNLADVERIPEAPEPAVSQLFEDIIREVRFTNVQCQMLSYFEKEHWKRESTAQKNILRQIQLFFILVLLQCLLLTVSAVTLSIRINSVEKRQVQDLQERQKVRQVQPKTSVLHTNLSSVFAFDFGTFPADQLAVVRLLTLQQANRFHLARCSYLVRMP